MERITSLQNPLIKQLKKLNSPASRREAGMFLVEGIKLCKEALCNGLEICYCLCGQDDTALALMQRCEGAQCYLVTDDIIAKLSDAKTPQKIIMAVKLCEQSFASVEGDMVLALDGISDPANLGSMLRTAEAFGVKDVVCSDQTVDLYSTKVLRGAMGSSFRVRVHRGQLAARLKQLKAKGYRVLATALSESNVLLHQVAFDGKCVIVIGNEGNGVSDEILALADESVLIPMAGKNESLNAAAAAAVVLWQAYSQKEL